MRVTLFLLLASWMADGEWTVQDSGTDARLRGLSVVDDKVAWASGSGGTVVRTTDGGRTWTPRPIAGAEALDFRDLHAFDSGSALLLATGPGGQARVYATADGGSNWLLKYQYEEQRGFLDAIAMLDGRRGLIMGDPVEGRFVILRTDDGGSSWRAIPSEGMPPARESEGAFAASGTCLVVGGEERAWFCTGGAGTARVFRTCDGGLTWEAADTPIPASTPASGAFSMAFRDERIGIVVGGDYLRPDAAEGVAAWTLDGGVTWHAPTQGPSGYRSAVAFMPGREGLALAVGPSGADLTADGGRTWRPIQCVGYDALGFTRDGIGWATGEAGRIGRWQAPSP